MSAAELEALLALQDVDTRIDQEKHRRATLAERAELSDVEEVIAQKLAQKSSLVSQRDEVAARQAEAESELQATEARMAQVHSKLYSGQVTATRELQAMAADEELLRKRVSELEDRALMFMEERGPLDAQVASLDAELAELQTRRAGAARALQAAEREVDTVLAELEGQRAGAKAAVPPKLLATYERLRDRLGGVAVARLVGGRCDGCHLSLPSMELDRIRHQAPGSLVFCEQCGRILVAEGS
ncbi:MAG: zinc ribbon domain-containing protein [Acidimicrobiales bacterium]